MRKPPSLLHFTPDWLDRPDQRDATKLNTLAIALAELSRLLVDETAQLILTDWSTEAFNVEGWDWPDDERSGKLQMIYHHLAQLIISPCQYAIYYPVPAAENAAGASHAEAHPLPPGCGGLASACGWCVEAGDLLRLHQSSSRDLPFLGLPCSSAFSGGVLSSYMAGILPERFPMVGPQEVHSLAPAYDWKLSHDIHHRDVSNSDVYKHIHLLGGRVREGASGTSHIPVEMENGRTWTIVRGQDPIPKTHLEQLARQLAVDLDLIRFVLTEGKFPPVGTLHLPGEHVVLASEPT